MRQYKVVDNPTEIEMNSLAAEGWELFHAHFNPPYQLSPNMGYSCKPGEMPRHVTGWLTTLWRRL